MKTKYDVSYWDGKVEDIMNSFDFCVVYRTMKELDWTWAGSKTTPPNIDDLRVTARRLLDNATKASVVDRKPHYTGTGGFEVETDPKEGYVSLKFVASEWDVWDE